MPPKKWKLGITSDGSGANSGDDDHGTQQFADRLGFNDLGVSRTLYQRAMSDFGIFGPGEYRRTKFTELCEWNAAHLAIAPKGQLNYYKQEYQSALNQLMQNVTKKAPPPRPKTSLMPPRPASARPPVRAPARSMQGTTALAGSPIAPRVPLTGAPPGVACGPLALSICHQPHLVGWALSVGGPPNTVRIHIITLEMHGPDPLYGGWIFSSATISSMVVLGLHSIAAILVAAAPFIPPGQVVRHIYAIDIAGRFVYITMDYLVRMMIMAHRGPNLMDFQVELDPIGQVNTPRVHMAAPTRLAAPTSAPASQHDTKYAKAILTKRATNVTASKGPLNQTKGLLSTKGKSSSSLVPKSLSRPDYTSSALRPPEPTKVQKHPNTAKGKMTAKGKTTAKTTTKQAPKGTPAAKAIKGPLPPPPPKVVIPKLRQRVPTDTPSDHEAPSSEDVPDAGASRSRTRHSADHTMIRRISAREPFWTGRRCVSAGTRRAADMEEEVGEHGAEEGLGGKVADDKDGDVKDSTDEVKGGKDNRNNDNRDEGDEDEGDEDEGDEDKGEEDEDEGNEDKDTADGDEDDEAKIAGIPYFHFESKGSGNGLS
ncbi:hypothetical protein L211DRAFT_854460 [Terfezia boudieri ATCC MYA-4762]|uniref:Uncharacterized protein n=1 Tax=Terfezia boudieri ATCC MYA-4762 TaxID=1051890 RepID=A0A3N4L6A5_9PEZI|nr:hypothetical protein L211DRAFT_854460 [Terfezia boudieri ATCC MYA-4762]